MTIALNLRGADHLRDALCAVLGIFTTTVSSNPKEEKDSDSKWEWHLPRTNQLGSRREAEWKNKRCNWRTIALAPLVVQLAVALLLTVLLWRAAEHRQLVLVPVFVGFLLSCSGLWAWRRILRTYLRYLATLHSLDKPTVTERPVNSP